MKFVQRSASGGLPFQKRNVHAYLKGFGIFILDEFTKVRYCMRFRMSKPIYISTRNALFIILLKEEQLTFFGGFSYSVCQKNQY